MKKTLFALIFCALVTQALPAAARAQESEEARLLRISKLLKPISDMQWNEIAGPKISENYDVQGGDTLWDISKRLFGNSYYWPKVWALNSGISNPHVIAPGEKLAFTPGSSESVPRLAPANAAENLPQEQASSSSQGSAAPAPNGKVRHEYDKVPADRWVPPDITKQVEKKYDAYGIDRDIKIDLPRNFTFRVPAIANETTIPFLGEIVSSRRDGVGLSQGETVFLKSAGQDLQVGTSYTVLTEPEFVREKKSDRNAYIYKSQGEVKIVGVRDDLYIGVIARATDTIKRGARLYPLLPEISAIQPIASTSAIEALVLLSVENDVRNSSQFRFVHFDRGIEDGIQIGNVFRIYDYYDPVTREKITDSDFLVNANAIVVHATAQFSTAMVLTSRDTFTRGDFGVSLTDVSDLEKTKFDRSKILNDQRQHNNEDKELDELDELDRTSGEGLGKQEEQEIKELDQWDRTKDLQNNPGSEPTVPSAAGTPTDQAEQFPNGETPSQEPSLPEQEPTLDSTLESPTVAPPPPENLDTNQQDQTLDAPPPPPPPAEDSAPEMSGSGLTPEPLSPEAPPMVEPVQPAPPDDVELQQNTQ